jgi:hypothetical protein
LISGVGNGRDEAAMTNDAKLGLVVGIGVVILIAIVFFRKDPGLAHAVPGPAQAAGVVAVPPAVPPPVLPRTQIPSPAKDDAAP